MFPQKSCGNGNSFPMVTLPSTVILCYIQFWKFLNSTFELLKKYTLENLLVIALREHILHGVLSLVETRKYCFPKAAVNEKLVSAPKMLAQRTRAGGISLSLCH